MKTLVRNREYFVCGRKRKFTKRYAKTVVKRMKAQGLGQHRLEVYRCNYCNEFHIGKRPLKKLT